MRVDLYTKIVLTVIAVCLVLLVCKVFEPISATATNEIVKVDLARIDGVPILQSPYLYDPLDLKLILGKIIGDDVRVRSSQQDPVYVEVVNPW